MAHIRRLPSGNWNAVVRHPSGRRLSRTDPLKRVVAAWATETETALRRGQAVDAGGRGLTFADWAARWRAGRVVEASTRRKETSALAVHLLPRWGAWPLRAIGRSDVQAWVVDLSGRVASSTAAGVYRLFRKIMGDAEFDGLIGRTPCRRITLPRVQRPAPRWLTRDEYDRLLLALNEDPHAATWRALIGLATFSGLRPGELGGLDVAHVDFARQLVRVEQVVTPGGLRPYPKTDASRRSVPFPDEVAALLWPLCADRPGGAPVFVMRRGGRFHLSNFTAKVWRPLLARAGVGHVRLYTLRHTCASWLVQAGVPREDIARLLGHRGTALVDTYAHLAPDAHDRVRAVWAGQLFDAGDPRAAYAAWGDRAGEDVDAGQRGVNRARA